jgi:hypothetical protein
MVACQKNSGLIEVNGVPIQCGAPMLPRLALQSGQLAASWR